MSKKRGNNEGSISRRKDGRWMGRYTVHTQTGSKQKAVYGKTRKEVAEKLKRVTPAHVQGLYRSMLDCGLSTRTVQYTHAVLRRAMKQATRWGMIPRNPCDDADVPLRNPLCAFLHIYPASLDVVNSNLLWPG